MIARTVDRVPAHTDPQINERIRRQTEMNIDYYAHHPEEIERRLTELDEEWDVERVLETGSSALSLAGLALGVVLGRRWLLLPLVVQSFFLQHALQGWCPPVPVIRRIGVRTQTEIEEERHALKALRGDFDALRHGQRRDARDRP